MESSPVVRTFECSRACIIYTCKTKRFFYVEEVFKLAIFYLEKFSLLGP